jgi:hypothetical protein
MELNVFSGPHHVAVNREGVVVYSRNLIYKISPISIPYAEGWGNLWGNTTLAKLTPQFTPYFKTLEFTTTTLVLLSTTENTATGANQSIRFNPTNVWGNVLTSLYWKNKVACGNDNYTITSDLNYSFSDETTTAVKGTGMDIIRENKSIGLNITQMMYFAGGADSYTGNYVLPPESILAG